MTDFKNIKFTGADVIKLLGFVCMVGSMWYDLKTDNVKNKDEFIAEQKLTSEKRVFLQYQIDELKKCCHLKSSFAAIMPREIKIENE